MHFTLILYFHLFVFYPHLSPPSLASSSALYAGLFPLPHKHVTKNPSLPHILPPAIVHTFILLYTTDLTKIVCAGQLCSPILSSLYFIASFKPGSSRLQWPTHPWFTNCLSVLTSHGMLKAFNTVSHFSLLKTFSLLQFSDTFPLLSVLSLTFHLFPSCFSALVSSFLIVLLMSICPRNQIQTSSEFTLIP